MCEVVRYVMFLFDSIHLYRVLFSYSFDGTPVVYNFMEAFIAIKSVPLLCVFTSKQNRVLNRNTKMNGTTNFTVNLVVGENTQQRLLTTKLI